MQKSVAVAKQDNVNLSAMLETVMKSHAGLQTVVESGQMEQAKKDSLIAQLKEKNKELCSIREHLEADLAAAETRFIVCREFEDAELTPLKRELAKVKEDYKRLVASMDALLIANKKLKIEIEKHQDDINKKTCTIDNLKEERYYMQSAQYPLFLAYDIISKRLMWHTCLRASVGCPQKNGHRVYKCFGSCTNMTPTIQ